jgi:uncharacterized metal-binding protein YceD (DUF177 family)
MPEETMPSPMPWTLACSAIGSEPSVVERTATAEECQAVARLLDVPACHRFSARAVVKAIGQERFAVSGEVRATLEQVCVVSLDPFEAEVSETFDVEFWPPSQLVTASEVDIDDFERDDPEPIENGRLDLGRLVYEILAAGLDPYPRLPGMELERDISGDAPEDRPEPGPFAGLAALKRDDGA